MMKPPRARYRTTNWSSHNAALRKRGSMPIWVDEEMAWLAPHEGRLGHPPVLSEVAIQFCLSIKGEGRPGNEPASVPSRVHSEPRRPLPWFASNHCRAVDSPILPELLGHIREDEQIGTGVPANADGACDTRRCHSALIDPRAAAIAPIRKNGRLCPAARARKETLRAT